MKQLLVIGIRIPDRCDSENVVLIEGARVRPRGFSNCGSSK